MDRDLFERRGFFSGLRVPILNISSMTLALAAVVLTYALDWLIGASLSAEALAGGPPLLQCGGWLVGLLSGGAWSAHVTLGGGALLVSTVLLLGLWGFFATAISRVAAVQIAREECLEIRDAATFGARKMLSSIVVVLFLAAVTLGLSGVANGVIGLISSCDFLGLGSLFLALAFPFVMLFTALAVCALAVGLFGLHLAIGAIATESSDASDGLLRGIQFATDRPWQTLLGYSLIGGYLAFALFFGSLFLSWSIDSLSWWGLDTGVAIAQVEADDLVGDLRKRHLGSEPDPKDVALWPEAKQNAYLESKKKLYAVPVPAKGSFIKGYVSGRYTWDKVSFYFDADDAKAALEDELGKDHNATIAAAENVAAYMPWTLKFAGCVLWFYHRLAMFLIAAFALQYIFNASTALYVLLRYEIEGEDFSEIVLDEEELFEPSEWEHSEPGPPVEPSTGDSQARAPSLEDLASSIQTAPAEPTREGPASNEQPAQ